MKQMNLMKAIPDNSKQPMSSTSFALLESIPLQKKEQIATSFSEIFVPDFSPIVFNNGCACLN